MTDDDATFEAGFAAFWANAEALAGTEAYRELRQAYKNGAAWVVAREVTQGSGAVADLVKRGDTHVIQEMGQWLEYNGRVHPDWGEVHLHALMSGAFSALTLWRIGRPIDEQLKQFIP